MPASFNSISLGEIGEGSSAFPSYAAKPVITLHRVPGGNRLVVQRTSDRLFTLTTTAKVDYAGSQALIAALGTRASLVLGTESGTARLVEVSGVKEILATDIYLCDLTFIVESVTFGRAGFGSSAFGSSPLGG